MEEALIRRETLMKRRNSLTIRLTATVKIKKKTTNEGTREAKRLREGGR